MRLHHLALLTPDPGRLAEFYGALLGVAPVRRLEDDAGLRAVWLDLEGTLLMIERGEARGGCVPVFAAAPGSSEEWSARFPVTDRTAFTLYGRDPDGNRFGVSSWPTAITG